MVNPRNSLFSPIAVYTPRSCIDYLIIFLPQESSHSSLPRGIRLLQHTRCFELSFSSVLGVLRRTGHFRWTLCTSTLRFYQFNTIYVDHVLLSGQQREGGIKAFIKPSSSFIFGNLYVATVNFHLLP